MLFSLPSLKSLELCLPFYERFDSHTVFDYRLVFPDKGKWPRLARFAIGYMAISPRDLVCLLAARIPSLRALRLNSIELLDGKREGMIEILKVATWLSSLEIDDGFGYSLTHCGQQVYNVNPYPLSSISDYVCGWRQSPDIVHPGLPSDHAVVEESVQYMHETMRLCGLEGLERPLTHVILTISDAPENSRECLPARDPGASEECLAEMRRKIIGAFDQDVEREDQSTATNRQSTTTTAPQTGSFSRSQNHEVKGRMRPLSHLDL